MPIVYQMNLKLTPNQFISNMINKKNFQELHNSYISFAQDILSNNFKFHFLSEPQQLTAINKLIRILSLEIQNTILQKTLRSQKDLRDISIFPCIPPRCPKCKTLNNCIPKIYSNNSTITFDISMNATISFPWDTERLANAFGKIGISANNPFVTDSNHFNSILFSPFNLLVVGNGYHSSTSGIYDTNAIYYPQEIYDISSFYNEIYFDGIAFRHKYCNTVIDYPMYKTLGTIYEIGRLLYERNLSLVHLPENFL